MTTRMKQTLLSICMTLIAITSAGQDALPIDTGKTQVLWTGTKLTGSHTGALKMKEGVITMNGDLLGAADIMIDMTSITCTDLQGTGAERLVGHLRSPDFFNTDEHPTATFRTTSVEHVADARPGHPNHKVTGDLTIKGITHPATFDCLVWREGRLVRAAGSLSFDRTKYGVQYRSGSVFPDIGDKLIHDEVSLAFDLRAE